MNPQISALGADISSHADISVGQLTIRYLIDGAEKKQMGAFELIIPANAVVPPPHSHRHNEEIIYVLEGKLRYFVNQDARELKPGDSMFTPKDAVHGFSNPFSETVRALVVLSPDVGAQYFRDVAAVVNAEGPPDRTKLLKIMEGYGLIADKLRRT
jgi:quercetin dioxygenase-like cupin family protein